MKDWKNALISPEEPISKAIRIIDAESMGSFRMLCPNRIALVVEAENRLIGIVTDGDIRQSHLQGFSAETPVKSIMNSKFHFCSENLSKEEIFVFMKEKKISQVPIIDYAGIVKGVELLEDYISPRNPDNWVVLMAGGAGTRLGELTKDCPKPLIEVGGRPVLETILLNFAHFGFKKFYIVVNFLAEKVIEMIGDGTKWGVEIKYLIEDLKLGTAGGLSLIPEKPTAPMIVMNGDVLTRLSLVHLLDFHRANNAFASMCVRELSLQVPFGVAQVDGPNLLDIDEKPTHKFFVNAGIYVMHPDVLDLIPKGCYYDMPDLFKQILQLQKRTIAFPIREYWMDIGRIEDLARAQSDFKGVFSDL